MIQRKNNIGSVCEFTPETAEEELMLLYGRIKAFEAYLNNYEFIEKDVCAEMLGLKLEKGKENRR